MCQPCCGGNRIPLAKTPLAHPSPQLQCWIDGPRYCLHRHCLSRSKWPCHFWPSSFACSSLWSWWLWGLRGGACFAVTPVLGILKAQSGSRERLRFLFWLLKFCLTYFYKYKCRDLLILLKAIQIWMLVAVFMQAKNNILPEYALKVKPKRLYAVNRLGSPPQTVQPTSLSVEKHTKKTNSWEKKLFHEEVRTPIASSSLRKKTCDPHKGFCFDRLFLSLQPFHSWGGDRAAAFLWEDETHLVDHRDQRHLRWNRLLTLPLVCFLKLRKEH